MLILSFKRPIFAGMNLLSITMMMMMVKIFQQISSRKKTLHRSHSQTSPAMPNAPLIASTVAVCLASSVTVLVLAFFFLVALFIWVIIGSATYNMAFHAGSNSVEQCVKSAKDNTPSKFGIYGVCQTLRDSPILVDFFHTSSLCPSLTGKRPNLQPAPERATCCRVAAMQRRI